MRLIDADALLAAYDAEHEGTPGRARELIEAAPTVELKQGKWERLTAKLLRCSVCGRVADEPTTFTFCPSCGADMREGSETDGR